VICVSREWWMKKCIVFTGGGTGGHVFPGLAVIDGLKKQWQGRIVWIGSLSGIEKKIVDSYQIPYYGIPAGKMRRYISLKNFFDMFNVLAGVFYSLYVLFKERPLLIFSKGGYVSVPTVIAGAFLGIPVFTHESDVDPGFATKINAVFAEKIFTSFRETEHYFSVTQQKKIIHTGNPVRGVISMGNPQRGRDVVGCRGTQKMLLVLGGSQGAKAINQAVDAILEKLTERYFVVHQMGEKHYRKKEMANYFPAPFFNEELPHILAAADLVICRAGANTLWELAVSGTPSILIPLVSGSRGDQIKNAEAFKECGAAIVVEENAELSEKLLEYIEIVFNNNSKLDEMASHAKGIVISDAVENIIKLIQKRVKGFL
jgi:UDP-N-acetylglucosamine--N-acetylmuramyl-(pentapeptide) pyrophosphoryl-undecaprenol N-acetylglucosamine transferase